MPETLNTADQYARYIANQTNSLAISGPNTENDRLTTYLNYLPSNMLRTEQVGADFLRFLINSRTKHLLPRSKKVNNARKRRIAEDANEYFWDPADISPDNDDLEDTVSLIREDAEDSTAKDEKKHLTRLASRIEETVREDRFREMYEIAISGKTYDISRNKVKTLSDKDIQRIFEIIEQDGDPAKPLSTNDLNIIRLFLIDSRQLAILACIYREQTPKQLLQKLQRLETHLVSWQIIDQVHGGTQTVFANNFMHLDRQGNIPFNFKQK